MGRDRMKKLVGLVALLACALCAPLDAAFSQNADRDATTQARISDPQVVRSLSLASGHHELAILYIKKGEMERAVAEARKILQLSLPSEHEHLVVKSIAIISDKMGEARRFELGQSLLDDALKVTEQSLNQVALLKTKARLYRQAGDDDRAIESFRKALDLEGRSIR